MNHDGSISALQDHPAPSTDVLRCQGLLRISERWATQSLAIILSTRLRPLDFSKATNTGGQGISGAAW